MLFDYSKMDHDEIKKKAKISGIVLCFALWLITSIVLSINAFIKHGIYDGLIMCLATFIGIPFALGLIVAFLFVYCEAHYVSYRYLRDKKNTLALYWIFLGLFTILTFGYLYFASLTDSLFYGRVFWPYENEGYYHSNEDCFYLDDGDFEGECEHTYLLAQINGLKPCKKCIDKEYGSRFISVICYLVFFIIIIAICEYKEKIEDKDVIDPGNW